MKVVWPEVLVRRKVSVQFIIGVSKLLDPTMEYTPLAVPCKVMTIRPSEIKPGLMSSSGTVAPTFKATNRLVSPRCAGVFKKISVLV